jgi:hypothetical protein
MVLYTNVIIGFFITFVVIGFFYKITYTKIYSYLKHTKPRNRVFIITRDDCSLIKENPNVNHLWVSTLNNSTVFIKSNQNVYIHDYYYTKTIPIYIIKARKVFISSRNPQIYISNYTDLQLFIKTRSIFPNWIIPNLLPHLGKCKIELAN